MKTRDSSGSLAAEGRRDVTQEDDTREELRSNGARGCQTFATSCIQPGKTPGDVTVVLGAGWEMDFTMGREISVARNFENCSNILHPNVRWRKNLSIISENREKFVFSRFFLQNFLKNEI